MDCLIDLNIILDLFAKRERFDKIVPTLQEYNNHYITTTTFSTLFYLLRKTQRNPEDIIQFVLKFKLVSILPKSCFIATSKAEHLDDIEDCCEMLTAKENNLVFITADKILKSKYPKVCKMKLIK